jgi:hypothetical protein
VRDLAIEFNQPSPRLMLSMMSCHEYIDWQRHFAKRGLTVDLENWRTARICLTTISPHLNPDADIKLSDFYPNPPEPREKTVEEIMAVMSCVPGVVRE